MAFRNHSVLQIKGKELQCMRKPVKLYSVVFIVLTKC